MARNLIFVALTLSYPLAIWQLGDRLEPRWLALSLVLLGALRPGSWARLWWVWPGGFRPGSSHWLSTWGGPCAGTVFVNNSLLLFVMTLYRPPSMAERLVAQEPNLPPHVVQYTRRVTQAWCGFFVINGSIAAATCLWGTDAQWALYNGGVAYVLMGLFAAAEYLIRQGVKRAHA